MKVASRLNDINTKRIKIVMNNGRYHASQWLNIEPEEFSEASVREVEAFIEKESLNKENIKQIIFEHKKNFDDYYVTDHAITRAKERLGWNKKTLFRMIPRIYDNGKGIKAEDMTNIANSLIKKSLDLTNKGAIRKVVFSDYVWVFSNRTLLTVYRITPDTQYIERRIQNKKRKWPRRQQRIVLAPATCQ